MVRPKLIVANWKMNLTTHQGSLLLHTLAADTPVHRDVEVVIAPSTLMLQSLSLQVNRRQFKLAVQNLYWRDEGAFTGEVSAAQLRGIADYAIIGHSERRHVFGETDKDIRAKVQAAIRNDIKPILCVGETAAERSDGETSHVIHDQISGGLANLTSDEMKDVTIAYEPVWAIGSGQAASPHDVEQVVKIIRSQVTHLYGKSASEALRVVYGGSVSAQSTADFLGTRGVDGLLVGGASLKAHEFGEIIAKAHKAS